MADIEVLTDSEADESDTDIETTRTIDSESIRKGPRVRYGATLGCLKVVMERIYLGSQYVRVVIVMCRPKSGNSSNFSHLHPSVFHRSGRSKGKATTTVAGKQQNIVLEVSHIVVKEGAN